MQTDADEILTAREVAKLLKCSPSMVYKLNECGELQASHKLFSGNKGFRWLRSDVSRYLSRARIALPLAIDGVHPLSSIPSLSEILNSDWPTAH